MSWLFCSSVILFVFSLIAALFDYFSLSIPFLSGLFRLVTLSSTFLTFICTVAIVAAWRKRAENKRQAVISIVIYAIDLAIINKLYLNSTWAAIGHWCQNVLHRMRDWNWTVILVSVFCAAVAAALIIWARFIWKNGQSGRSKKPDASKITPVAEVAPTQSDAPTSSEENDAEKNEQTSSESNNGGAAQNKTSQPTSFAYGLVCILLIFPATALIQYIFYRVLKWNVNLPYSLNNSVDILFYIGTISFGVVVVLLLWISKKKGTSHTLRPALWAFIAEIIIVVLFFSGAKIVNEELLNTFLSAAANNTLIATVVVPIVLFVVLDIGFSLFIKIFFEKPANQEESWIADARKSVDDIERGIVMFVLNLFAGLINVFLLIPDFLSEIGELLLEKDNLFPRTKLSPPAKEKPPQEDNYENISHK